MTIVRTSFATILCSLAFGCPVAHAERLPDVGSSVPSLAAVVSQMSPGVVGISVGQDRESSNPLLQDPAFRRFFEETFKGKQGRGAAASGPVEVRPAGSGVVVDAQGGLVLTNHHVIHGASRLVVVLKDRRELPAELVGSDPGTDVAVLKVKPERLVAVPMGNSDDMKVGDFVLAIGNPFGLGQTVTSGIVSALGRGISPEGYEDYIQTDAAINPGNSGGALINMRGELIGINTAILSSGRGRDGGGGNIGIGFAVPTVMAKEVMGQILKYGEVKRGRIGIETDEVTEDLANSRGLTSIAGALIRTVAPGSTAERAGLKSGDIVTQVDGRPVRTASDLRNRVALVPVESQVRVQVWRNRQSLNLQIPVESVSAAQVAASQQPSPSAADTGKPGSKPARPQSGSLSGAQLSDGREGVVANSVAVNSAAHQAGLRSGDIILAVNRQVVTTVQAFTTAMGQPGSKTLSILRGESKLRLTLG